MRTEFQRTEVEPTGGWHRFELRRIEGEKWLPVAVHVEGYEAPLDDFDGRLADLFMDLSNRVVWTDRPAGEAS